MDDVAALLRRAEVQPTPIAVDPAAVGARARAAAQCAICHGPDGQGRPREADPEPRRPAARLPAQPDAAVQGGPASPGDAVLKALKALMRTIPDETFADLAAYYSSLR